MSVILDYSWNVDETDNPLAVTQSGQGASSGAINRIHVWCKGLRVTATIRVRTFAAEQNTTWRVGFVQILEYSKMKAHYGKGIQEWEQQILPCYDSTTNADIPWYTANSHHAITAVNQQINLTMQDYPTSHVDPFYHRPGFGNDGNGLTHYIKHNKFNLYLIQRKETPRYSEDTILRHLNWTTKVELEAKDQAIWQPLMYSVNGYRVKKHDRSVSLIHAPVIHKFDRLPPTVNGTANQNINETKRDAHHHWWWWHH